nr:PREDICTED: cell wall protein DAN4 [Bemisia tabaci]
MAKHQFVLLSLCASAVLLLSGLRPAAAAAAAAATPTSASATPAPARTKYIPKWKKQACEAPASLNSASHYECDDNGNVQCLPGWTGDVCDVPICRKGCDPLQGYCKRPGECRCKLGFYGELCNKCIALPGCQHGYCNNSFECICHEGWDGLFCSEPICRLDCHATRGYCEWPGECRCRLGWSGETCKECQVLPGCAHGACSKPLECKCEKGWTGILCQTPICAEGCHKERGYCRKPGECRCKVGWWGENCDECYRYPGCVHGSCQRPWECTCEPGWGGMLCDQELNFCDENPDLCENNGTCVSLPEEDGSYRCLCTDNFTGRNCDVNKTVNEQQVIGMRPPPPPPPTPSKEPTYSTTPTEKETTSEQPSSSLTTSTSPSSVSENNEEAILEETTSTKPSTTTTSVKPSLRRASTSRTTEIHRTSSTKNKFRKTPEDKNSESTKRPDPHRKSSRTFGGMNEILGVVPSEIFDRGSISIGVSKDGTIDSLRLRGLKVQNDDKQSLIETAADSQNQKERENLAGHFFELVGSSGQDATGIADEPTALKSLKSRRRRGVLTQTVEKFFPTLSASHANTESQLDQNRIYSLSDTVADNQPKRSRAIDSHSFKTLVKNREDPLQRTTEESLIELESDGVLEIRPAKASTHHGLKRQSNSPISVQQRNEALSQNRNEAGLQVTLFNQSRVSGITYHDRRKSYHIQNWIENFGGSKGSDDVKSRPIVNIFVYTNGNMCSCRNISMEFNQRHPDCICDESLNSKQDKNTENWTYAQTEREDHATITPQIQKVDHTMGTPPTDKAQPPTPVSQTWSLSPSFPTENVPPNSERQSSYQDTLNFLTIVANSLWPPFQTKHEDATSPQMVSDSRSIPATKTSTSRVLDLMPASPTMRSSSVSESLVLPSHWPISISPSRQEPHHSKMNSSMDGNNLEARNSSSNTEWWSARNRITDLLSMFFNSGEDPTRSRFLQQRNLPKEQPTSPHLQLTEEQAHMIGKTNDKVRPSNVKDRPIQRINPNKSDAIARRSGIMTLQQNESEEDSSESLIEISEDMSSMNTGNGHYLT